MNIGESDEIVLPRAAVGRAGSGDAVHRPAPTVVAAVVVGGLAIAAIAATLTIRSHVLVDPVANGATRAFLIAVWVTVGLVTWRRRPRSRLGSLMIVAAAGFAATTVLAVPGAAVFTLGRMTWAGYFVLFVFVLLAFPNGRLDPGGPTRVFRAALFGTVLLWPLLMLVSRELPAGIVLTWCARACPQNALRVADLSPAASRLASDVVGVLTSVLWIGVAIVVLTRVRNSRGLARRTLMPLLICLCVGTLCAGISEFVRHVSGQVPVAFVFGWIAEAAAVALPLALLLGQARGRLLSDAVMRDALPRFATHRDGREVQSVLAAALRDPSLELFFWLPSANAYVDAEGRRFDPEQVGERSITEIRHDDRLVAAIVHDRALDDTEGLVEEMGSAALLALENLALQSELRASEAELRAVLARIASASVRERQRLERDIHDGAQNRLVALRVKLALAEERVDSSTVEELRVTLGALGDEAQAAIDTLRTIAHGVYPPLLASRGVGSALVNEATRAALAVCVLKANEIARSTPDAEGAVYFCCLEAIQNSVKHAGPHARVTIRLEQSGEVLTLSAADDGVGFDQATSSPGQGLTNMRDRISAVGGVLDIVSKPGLGTIVSGTVPWRPRQPES